MKNIKHDRLTLNHYQKHMNRKLNDCYMLY